MGVCVRLHIVVTLEQHKIRIKKDKINTFALQMRSNLRLNWFYKNIKQAVRLKYDVSQSLCSLVFFSAFYYHLHTFLLYRTLSLSLSSNTKVISDFYLDGKFYAKCLWESFYECFVEEYIKVGRQTGTMYTFGIYPKRYNTKGWWHMKWTWTQITWWHERSASIFGSFGSSGIILCDA